MRFSIILPTRLDNYDTTVARNRDEKLERAIKSVMCQTFQDFELIIIADGCKKSVEIAKPYFYEYLPKIRIIEIPAQKAWSGKVRNAGISVAKGDIITYIDNDDFWGANHLQIINDGFMDYDWVWYNHLIYDNAKKDFVEYHTNINVHGQCGTSSISHKRSLGVYWMSNDYSHDFVLIKSLKKASDNYGKIGCTEYKVCHTPYGIDV